jgi:hypothetical protein
MVGRLRRQLTDAVERESADRAAVSIDGHLDDASTDRLLPRQRSGR